MASANAQHGLATEAMFTVSPSAARRGGRVTSDLVVGK